MKIPHAPSFRRTRLASACGLLLAGVTVAHAQGAAAAAAPASAASAADRADVQSVTVTGIRASLETSLALKRDAHGIVDGITAEDVGKFPDTNLAEAMQRISGVSIDRAANEGSKITVRGFGPDYNMILLNGRQLPTSTVMATGASTPTMPATSIATHFLKAAVRGRASVGATAASTVLRNSVAVAKRNSGVFSSARRTTASIRTSTCTRFEGGTTSSLGRSPVSIS